MTERREPTISATAIREPARQTDEPAKIRERVTTGGYRPEGYMSASPPPKPDKSFPVTAVLALLVSFGACGFGGYLFKELTSAKADLGAANAKLEQAEGRVTELENKLSLSDDESTQNLTVVSTAVKENSSEIRKLWGVAYDRNRKKIAELDKSIASVKKQVSGGDDKLKKSLDGLQKSLGSLKSEFALLSEIQEAQQTAFANIEKQSKQRGEKLTEMLNSLNALDGALKKRIVNNEEAIASIDNFRRKVNQDILKLKQHTQANW